MVLSLLVRASMAKYLKVDKKSEKGISHEAHFLCKVRFHI